MREIHRALVRLQSLVMLMLWRNHVAYRNPACNHGSVCIAQRLQKRFGVLRIEGIRRKWLAANCDINRLRVANQLDWVRVPDARKPQKSCAGEDKGLLKAFSMHVFYSS